ncbi:MAG: S-methyl-5-thioribose-1-phosphate isomerase [Planctomycetota bacterium]|nr:S-methyl-5-thioribose-1-phosphate isomerase [Planctomycetota bacterium]
MPEQTVRWVGGLDGRMEVIDQTLLPVELRFIHCRTVEQVREAIKVLRVRGAPAIGVAAAMGVVVAVQDASDDEREVLERVGHAAECLATSRPTAVNLFWAIDRMKRIAQECRGKGGRAIKEALLKEARAIRDEDAAMGRHIGDHGQHLVKEGCGVLTHCNAGSLATAEYGTALAPLYRAHELGRRFHVYADETRPLLQGARLTMWELQQAGIDCTLICDNTAAVVMRERKVNLALVGADRIAANGDTANKIGTYGVAVLAKHHGIPFYVAAPSSTFDLAIASGDQIPIEERGAEEVTHGFGRQTAPAGAKVYCPAFDVTPAELIAGIITERGLIEKPDKKTIAKMLK